VCRITLENTCTQFKFESEFKHSNLSLYLNFEPSILCLNLNLLDLNFQRVGMKYCRIVCLYNGKSLNYGVLSGLENNLYAKHEEK
jgi:hypothetical protein